MRIRRGYPSSLLVSAHNACLPVCLSACLSVSLYVFVCFGLHKFLRDIYRADFFTNAASTEAKGFALSDQVCIVVSCLKLTSVVVLQGVCEALASLSRMRFKFSCVCGCMFCVSYHIASSHTMYLVTYLERARPTYREYGAPLLQYLFGRSGGCVFGVIIQTVYNMRLSVCRPYRETWILPIYHQRGFYRSGRAWPSVCSLFHYNPSRVASAGRAAVRIVSFRLFSFSHFLFRFTSDDLKGQFLT